MSLGWRRFLLLVFFAIALLAQLYFAAVSIRSLLVRTYPSPELIDQATYDLTFARRETPAVPGLDEGDRLVRMAGTEVRSRGDIARRLNQLEAGQRIELVFRTKDGGDRGKSYVIPPLNAEAPSATEWATLLSLNLVIPTLSILLAFFIVWRRPNDWLAWLLLFGLYGLSQTSRSNGILRFVWPEWLSSFGHFLVPFGTMIWPTAWLWFCLDFPDPKSRRKLLSWSRWAIGVPGVLFALLIGTETVLNAEFAKSIPVDGLFRFLMKAQTVYIWLPIVIGFANLIYKLKLERHPDAQRRLRVLLFGLGLGLLPLITGVAVGFGRLPNGVQITIVLLVVFVPLTIAYVLIVERAMDVGVVVRQGLQYALARRGVGVLRGVLMVALMLLVYFVGSESSLKRPARLAGIAVLFAATFLLQAGADRLKRWIDRRFFREAVDAERVLTDLGRRVRNMVEPEPLLAMVTQQVADALHVPRVAALLARNGDFVTANAYGFPEPVMVQFPAEGETVGQVRKGPQRIYREHLNPWVQRLGPVEKEQLLRLDPELLLPVMGQEGLLGILSLSSKRSEEPYSGSDIRLLESVTTQTGLALENSRLAEKVAQEATQRERLHSELQIAREVQERLLPKYPPRVAGLDVAGVCRPAQTIGGDYFDYIATPGGSTGFAIGDIAGKGVPAALLMASLQSSLRGLIAGGVVELRDLMARLNRLIYEATPANRFATFFYGVYEPQSGLMRCACAGHNAALHLCADGRLEWIKPRGLALGLTRQTDYEHAEFRLEPGALLILYTDGVIEAMGPGREEFGEERLERLVQSHRNAPAAELLSAIVTAVEVFAQGEAQHDDMTLIVIRAV